MFWERNSESRQQWLEDYEKLTSEFKSRGVTINGLNALHVAATIGFPHLVESLTKAGYTEEMNQYDDLMNQPVGYDCSSFLSTQ